MSVTRRDHRICRVCGGSGEVWTNESNDPQTAKAWPCDGDGCLNGWVRTRPLDPMDVLAEARRNAFSASWGAQWYGSLRQRIVSPVLLP
ncbi:hypothetical protein [Arenimonas sp.]|uniref:hypothetical protein n=1 Tax=Arenimonas sp. TaxID=1872635 RepID=UPI0039E68C7C